MNDDCKKMVDLVGGLILGSGTVFLRSVFLVFPHCILAGGRHGTPSFYIYSSHCRPEPHI